MVSYNAPMQVLYSQESLTRMLSAPGIDFSTIGTEKTAFYLIMPDEKTTVHSIVSLMIKQCYESLIHTAQQQERRTLPIRVNFLLDEFANLPTIPDSCEGSTARTRTPSEATATTGCSSRAASWNCSGNWRPSAAPTRPPARR